MRLFWVEYAGQVMVVRAEDETQAREVVKESPALRPAQVEEIPPDGPPDIVCEATC